MTRFLALLLLAMLIGLAARRLLLRARRSPLGQLLEAVLRSGSVAAGPTGATPAPRTSPRAVGALSRCESCGVHVPTDRITVSRSGESLCARCVEQRDRSRSA